MRIFLTLTILTLITSVSWGQITKQIPVTSSIPITIKWVDHIEGDFSFTNKWSYPLGVARKNDGKAGCADGGFCPDRCYSMLDSNGIVRDDSSAVFYQLLDTTHQFHTIACEAWCYEWAGTDFINVFQNNMDTVTCFTMAGIATHCSLELTLIRDSCYATINLNSVVHNGDATFYSISGFFILDQTLWKKGIMKAEFSFVFEHLANPNEPMYWKGLIYSPLNQTDDLRKMSRFR